MQSINSVERPDLLVIGSGSAGFSAAQTARELGATVLLVDRDPALAGQCILRGCMPAKAVFHAAEVTHIAETAEQSGVEIGEVTIDPQRIVARERALVQSFAEDRRRELEKFDVINGCAAFVDSQTVEVEGRRIEPKATVIACGSSLQPPAIQGLEQCGYVTAETVFQRPIAPRSLIVLGGGPVGCEFAQYFARLSTKVILLQDASQVLRSEDRDVAESVERGLHNDGVDVVRDVVFQGSTRCGNSKTVTVLQGGKERVYEADEILLTIERRPNVHALNAERAGIKCERGIVVDEALKTTHPYVYAAGDAIGRRMLVHAAVQCGAIAARNALTGRGERVDFDLLEAHSVYTDPEVAVTGLTEREAQRRGISYRVASYDFAEHGRAMTEDAVEGFVKMLADNAGRVLGITIVGKHAGELIHEALTLLYFRASAGDVTRIPHLHPTLAEILTYPAAELAS